MGVRVILQIAKTEFLELTRDGRFRRAALALLALFAVALASGFQRFRDFESMRQAADRGAREVWLDQTDKAAHMAGYYGTYAFKPRTPLSFIDPGLEPLLGVAVFLEAHRRKAPVHPPARDSSGVHRFGGLNAATLLQVVLPLLIIVLAHSSFAGERERGTLRLVASLGVRPRQLAVGKMLGIGAALAVLTLPVVAAGLIALALAGELSGVWMSAAVMIAGYGLYLGGVVALAVAASAWSPSSRLALVTLFGVWIANCAVVPRLAAEIARLEHPTPTPEEFQEAIRKARRGGIDGHDPADRRIAQLTAELLAKYKVDKVSDLPFNFTGIAMQLSEESTNSAYAKGFQGLWDVYERQDRTRGRFGLAAPLLAIRSLSMGLAGTDFPEHRRFEASVERHRNELIRALNHDQAYNPRARERGYKAGRELWEKTPTFHHERPTEVQTLARERGNLAILGGWFAIALAALALAAGRYRYL